MSSLVELADTMRANGIHRACFAEDGSVTECELDAKFTPPDAPTKPLTDMEKAVAADEAKKAAARALAEHESLLFMAAEGYPRP